MDKTFTPEKLFVKKVSGQKEEYTFEPSKIIVDSVLAYSKSLSVRDSKVIDKIELILN